jgi:hypothetical protein
LYYIGYSELHVGEGLDMLYGVKTGEQQEVQDTPTEIGQRLSGGGTDSFGVDSHGPGFDGIRFCGGSLRAFFAATPGRAGRKRSTAFGLSVWFGIARS